MKRIAILSLIVVAIGGALGLTLKACSDAAEGERRDFASTCAAAEFSAKQCALLWALKQDSDSANDSAAFAVGFSAVTAGSAAARR